MLGFGISAILQAVVSKESMTAALGRDGASTNLVAELRHYSLSFEGWQFMVGEWIGGVVLVVILSCLMRLTYPKKS